MYCYCDTVQISNRVAPARPAVTLVNCLSHYRAWYWLIQNNNIISDGRAGLGQDQRQPAPQEDQGAVPDEEEDVGSY